MFRGGYYWPDHDKDAHPVLLMQQNDIKKVLKYVEDFGVCVQAGGNVGIWPKVLSRHFDTVFTFEPDPENYACLLKNIKEQNVIPFNVALSDKHENIHVRSPDKFHTYNCGAYQVFEGGMPSMRIDDLELASCGLIYLDVEGYELRVLGGAAETIKKFKPIIVFEDKKLPNNYGKEVGDIEKWLEGYKVAERIHRDVICCPCQEG